VTIADVARRAGVSTAAASKVLRNAYGTSNEMQAKVRQAIDELGYRPHAGARAMRGHSYTIGLILDSVRNPFYNDILDGINTTLSSTEYQVLIGSGGLGSQGKIQTRLVEAMIDRGMDGLILVAPTMPREFVVEQATSIPTVVMGNHDRAAEFDTVVGDDNVGASMAVDHLVSLGHRHIAHTSATGHPAQHWARRPEHVRAEGYEAAMRRHGLESEILMAVTNYSEDGGYKAGLELLDRHDRPTAIFAGADVAAFGVFRAAEQVGLRVPGDVALVGYDNTSVAGLAPVQLTSVDQGGHELGSAAARLLLERIRGRTRSVFTATAPTLAVRTSSGWDENAPLSSSGETAGAEPVS
jgi:LacI family transcriptional regulator